MKVRPIIKRKSFAKVKPLVEIPDLLYVQRHSYEQFLQKDVPPQKRRHTGLQMAFEDIFPIVDIYGKYELHFDSYRLGEPRFTFDECRKRNLTYSASLYIKLQLREFEKENDEKKLKEMREGEVFLGDLPMMTPYGTFVINGAERVVVTQLHRSPGVFFDETIHPNGKRLFSARMIPLQGSWMEIRLDIREVLHAVISARKKVPISTLLRAMGIESDREIVELFHKVKNIKLSGKTAKKAVNALCAEEIIDKETGEVLFEIGSKLTPEDIELLQKHKIKEIPVVIPKNAKMIPIIFETLRADETKTKFEAIQEVYSGIRPGDVVQKGKEETIMSEYFFNTSRFDLGEVGRHKINQRLQINVPEDTHILTLDDIVATSKYIIGLRHGEGTIDDIDHLGVRRARSVGELVANQVRIGLARLSRTVRQRMRTRDMEKVTPSDLINSRTVVAVINSFFGSSQLSQFLDQPNPIAELTHKRRLSALGAGGLTRERAGFEVRDVHYTHYGRMCPIETPEGQNIGLITSLATYAKINKYGFIETPYRIVKNRVATSETIYMSADEEDRHTIAKATEPLDSKGRIKNDKVIARRRSDLVEVPASEVDLMDVSPAQIVSIAAALIPFLEHDDASRALMGSNMQRQAVPLLFTEAPVVGTGQECKAAVDSGSVVIAKRSGIVSYVDSRKIIITPSPDKDSESKLFDDKDVYPLMKFRRSNQNTAIIQRPLVKKGEKIVAGQIIADGTATDRGDLALGKNVLVAFMSWHGYNYEDAIIISERLVKDDIFTSLHIEKFELQVRETKLGSEELTREIPNVSEEAVKNLDAMGIVRVGAHVRSGDILVGKVTPKGETELTPEMRLLKAIFGEKAGDVKDSSLRVPPGVQGVVIDRSILSRRGYRKGRNDKEEIRKLEREHLDEIMQIKQRRDKQIRELLVDKRAKNIISNRTGKPIIKPGTKLTKAKVLKLSIEDISDKTTWTSSTPTNIRIQRILKKANDIIEEREKKLRIEKQKIMRGDELLTGVMQLVKVDIAMKRKVSIGDKMAGRHGNKGVISIIVPQEDMPYLEDGTPVDIILNPLGVPSRMNIGQILETHLGRALAQKGELGATPVFNGATVEEIKKELKSVGLPEDGKTKIYDGRTGVPFNENVTVGIIYMMKLIHLADDKIHARSIGPYSLVTQQPLGGKAQFGGQRFGEMEVWAFEAYGAAYVLQEMLTVKSDDVHGRSKMYEAIVKGENPPEPGIPESFNVLVKELQSLCIDVQLINEEETALG